MIFYESAIIISQLCPFDVKSHDTQISYIDAYFEKCLFSDAQEEKFEIEPNLSKDRTTCMREGDNPQL
jgi:hypothetical protein